MRIDCSLRDCAVLVAIGIAEDGCRSTLGVSCALSEANVPESFTVFDLPPQHWVKMRTSNMIERVNQELKQRTRVIRVFPNIASLLLSPVTSKCTTRGRIKMYHPGALVF